VDLETFQRGLGDLPDIFRTAVEASPTLSRLWIDVEPELGSDHYAAPEGSQCFAYQLFVHERPVTFSGIEEGDATFDGRPDQRNAVLLLHCWAVPKAQPHTAEPDS